MEKIAHLMKKTGAVKVCNVCAATFSTVKSLEDHVEALHIKIPVYECDFCSTSFPSRTLKYNHIAKFHREENKLKNVPHY